MNESLKESYGYCCQIAKTQAKNFYYSFLPLPKEKRQAMCAIYSFMRYCDDAVDNSNGVTEKRRALVKCKLELDHAIKGQFDDNLLFPAFQDTVIKYQIPAEYFYQLIEGMEMDLEIKRYQTFDDLYQYWYKVASVVGLVSIYIFQFNNDKAKEYAEYCGIGFQLTNIIRDISEDIRQDRVYIPQEDLLRFNCKESDLSQANLSSNVLKLLEYEVKRAEEYYHRALPLIPLIDSDARPCLIAMMKIYGGLLEKIRERNYDVFSKRIKLTKWKKMFIMGQAWCEGRSIH